MAPTLWYLFRYLPRRWRFSLARALVWGGGYVSEGFIEPHAGSVRGYRADLDGTKWYHESQLRTPESVVPGLRWRQAEGEKAMAQMYAEHVANLAAAYAEDNPDLTAAYDSKKPSHH